MRYLALGAVTVLIVLVGYIVAADVSFVMLGNKED